jgi:hypothetical protein
MVRVFPLLRTPVLDIDLIAGRARLSRPQILAPARIIDAASDVGTAADALVEWARGEVIDLWKPVGWNSSSARMRITRTIPAQPQPAGALTEQNRKRAIVQVANLSRWANGAELIATERLSGAGELHLVNNTELEAIAILLRQRVPLRAIYIKPKSEALLLRVGSGFYDVHLEFGRGLDPQRLQFQKDRFAPDRLGPFEFFEIVSAGGTSGQHYEVVVNPP